MTRPGTMREQITVARNTPSPSLYGENADSWATTGTFFADVREASGMERLVAGQPLAQRSYRIATRFRQDSRWFEFISGGPFLTISGERLGLVDTRGRIMSGDRIAWRGRTLEITGVRDSGERHRFTEIDAVEVMA